MPCPAPPRDDPFPFDIADAEPDGEARDDRVPSREVAAETGPLRGPVAFAGRIDRRELGADRLDEVAVGDAHAVRATSGEPGRAGARPAGGR